jgi:hypothetical protein
MQRGTDFPFEVRSQLIFHFSFDLFHLPSPEFITRGPMKNEK